MTTGRETTQLAWWKSAISCASSIAVFLALALLATFVLSGGVSAGKVLLGLVTAFYSFFFLYIGFRLVKRLSDAADRLTAVRALENVDVDGTLERLARVPLLGYVYRPWVKTWRRRMWLPYGWYPTLLGRRLVGSQRDRDWANGSLLIVIFSWAVLIGWVAAVVAVLVFDSLGWAQLDPAIDGAACPGQHSNISWIQAFLTWHTLDLIPIADVPETLDWKLNCEYTGLPARIVLAVYKFAIVGVAFGAIVTVMRSVRDGRDEKRVG
jgi:hypothetical protein